LADLFLGRPRSRRFPKFNIRRDIPLEDVEVVRALVAALDEAFVLAREIADTLEYAHYRGIVHCDVKLANVKFIEDERAKVVDPVAAASSTSWSSATSECFVHSFLSGGFRRSPSLV